MKQRLSAMILAICMWMFCLPVGVQASGEEIILLYENDVHCALDGYAKLAAMKQELAQTNEYVGVVSVGDFVQGSSLGVISQGEYVVNIMNMVGYDAVTLGNHEFDYRIPRLLELVEKMNTKPVCSNFQKLSDTDTMFAPYTIVTYGEVDVAFIGITTPDTMTSSAPAQFLDENGDYAYTFHGNDLYDTVQNSIDAAEDDGADYIVALSHLGTENVYEKWSAQTLIGNTSGLDVVLDGHSHSVVEQLIVEDKDGNEVVVSSTGTQFEHIGKLTIADGAVTTQLIDTDTYEQTDAAVTDYIAQIHEEYQQLGERVIGVSEVNLTTEDEDGNRIIRNTETNLGDFCADAFREVTGADIGFVNGGGIRANIAVGNITFNDLLSVFPWNNLVCVAEVTGQQIVDMLELGVTNYPAEDGSFQHVSGITFALNGSIESTVELDDNMLFVNVSGQRRVSDVKVLNRTTGEYEPIDLNKTYTLASHSHLLLEQGGGATMFKDARIIMNNGMLDVELLEIFVTEHLGGVVGEEYAAAQNRIRMVDGEADAVPEYTVTYVVDGAVVATLTVHRGEDAQAPELPQKQGYTATWDHDGKNITADTVITAQYIAVSDGDSPKTGDNDSWVLTVVLMGASMFLIATGAFCRKGTSNE